jgi:DNA processing protein
MDNELIFKIALTKIPNIGNVHAKSLMQIFKEPAQIFKASKANLEKIEGIGSVRASSIKAFKDFDVCKKEIDFIEKHAIDALFFTDEKYPKRLLNCYDSPIMLYYKGNSNLNASKIISVVGTRNNSEYGKHICEKFISDLKLKDCIIVSGLAYGIDTIAHKAALNNNIETIGVLAHGLDRIYPSANKQLAKEMIFKGGLLTEFISGTNPDKQNFPNRNRITAGICDALIVIETSKKGGSLITAEIANDYNKDVFAFPGKVTDIKSEGCNKLIQLNKAHLITHANDLLEMMQWNEVKTTSKKRSPQLFYDFNEEELEILEFFKQKTDWQIDELCMQSKMNNSKIAAVLLSLEMNGIIISLPGKIYRYII